MKVILYMAMTANGMIARKDGDSRWVSEEDNKSFTAMCRKCGAVIMGRKTYDVLSPDDLPLKEGIHLILTKNKNLESDNPTVVFMDASPKQAVDYLENKGFKTTCLIGGAQTVTQFMKAGLVDEIYLDVEPLVFGEGIPLIAPAGFEYKLKLFEAKKLSEQTIQLHYMVHGPRKSRSKRKVTLR